VGDGASELAPTPDHAVSPTCRIDVAIGEGDAGTARDREMTSTRKKVPELKGVVAFRVREAEKRRTRVVRMQDSALSTEFEKHANMAQTYLGDQLTDSEQLTMYGLYKQATVGDCDRTGWSFSPKEHMKRNSWSALRGVCSDDAKRRYCCLTATFMARMESERGA